MKRIIRFYRRSLFFKVFSLTAVLSIAVIYLIGSNLYGRITQGIYDQKIASAISEGRSAIQYAEYRYTIAGISPSVDYAELTEELVKSANVSAEESGREVALFNVRGAKVNRIPAVSTSNFLEPESVPTDLREATRKSESLEWQRGELQYVNGRVIPGVFIGKLIEIPRAGKYEMYIAYDFVAQERSIDLIGQSLAGAGFLLMMLILLIASVVLRMVIKPVQIAAEIAESLTRGDLNSRMNVKGEDEVARLGIAFNQMASTLADQISRLENLSRERTNERAFTVE